MTGSSRYIGYARSARGGPDPEGDTMTTTHTWDEYPLMPGTVTDQGVIEALSLTAYMILGQWVPFQSIHGPKPTVEPLVVIR